MTIRQGKNVIAGRADTGATHYLGEWVLSTTADNVIPEGCIKPDGYEQLDAPNSLFSDLWNVALTPSPDWKKPFITPLFTSNSQDGFTISDTKNNLDVYKVLNGVDSYNIKSNWNEYAIQIQSPINCVLNSYDITSSNVTPASYPSGWKIQGSLDGLKWEDIVSINSQSFTPKETKSYLVTSEKQYKYYSIAFTSGTTSNNTNLLGKINLHFSKNSTYLDTCTYQEYAEDVRKYGYCAKWAVDYFAEKFKVPFVPDSASDWGKTTIKTNRVPVVGNGMALGLYNGTEYAGPSHGGSSGHDFIGAFTGLYGQPVGDLPSNVGKILPHKTIGITPDPTKSGIEADLSNIETNVDTKFRVRWFIYIANGEIGDFLINWNKLQETLHINNGIEIGDINFTLGLVDERKNLRRKLNGQVISLDLFPIFAEKIKDLQALSPERFVTETEWQNELANSPNNICGKFVLDIANNSVRLPKYPEYLGKEYIKAPVSAGEPHENVNDISENYISFALNPKEPYTSSGHETLNIAEDSMCLYTNAYSQTHKNIKFDNLNADMSKSTHESIPVTYYIQVATGSSDRQEIVNTIELNNPYSLLDCKWSDHKLENISWLLSQGQWNIKGAYPAVYNLLLKDRNSGMTQMYCYASNENHLYFIKELPAKEGDIVYNANSKAVGTVSSLGLMDDTIQVAPYEFHEGIDSLGGELPRNAQNDRKLYFPNTFSVKLNTENYTDYDYVLNTTNETFRLPIKSKIVGGGKAPVITGEPHENINKLNDNATTFANQDKTPIQDGKQRLCISGDGSQMFTVAESAGSKNLNVRFDNLNADLSKATNDKLYLYFYVGETVQNANLIDAGRFSDILATKLDGMNISAYVIKTYTNGKSGYRIWSDGYCEQWGFVGQVFVPTSVTFLKAYKNADINMEISVISNASAARYSKEYNINSFTANDFHYISYDGEAFWRAWGYLEKGEY